MTFLEFIATAFLSDFFASEQEERRDEEQQERLQEELDDLRSEIESLKNQDNHEITILRVVDAVIRKYRYR